MDGVNANQANGTVGIEVLPMERNSIKCYAEIIHSHESVYENHLNSGMPYEIEEQDLAMVNDYQVALKCLNHLEKDPKIVSEITRNDVSFETQKHYEAVLSSSRNIIDAKNETVVKIETSNFKTTDDECMAVEALRQLGGMYNNVVQEKDLPLLSCNLCDREFNTTSDFHTHFAICKDEANSSFTCSNCQEVFDNKHEFNVHSCYLQEMLSCKFCNQNFFCKSDLQAHVNNEHQGDKPYRCDICHSTFPRPSSLKNHLKIHTYVPGRALFSFVPVNDQLESPETAESETLKWPSDQLIYVDKNSSDPLNNFNYGTATCLVQTELHTDINLSVGQEMVVNTSYDDSSDHSQLEYSSSSIDKSLNFPYQNDLNYDRSIKMESVPYLHEVEKMDETFPISSIPQMEVTIGADGKRPHVCSHCGATFTRAKALSSHLKLHLIGWSNKYECDSCGENFQNENLKLNHKEHCLLSNTLLSAIPDSNKDSSAGDEVAKTVSNPEVKKNVKPFLKVGKHSCPECQKKFTTKQKMFRHMWIHRKKTFSCEMCAMTFEVQADLDKHRLSQHPTDSPYVCQECGKCFASRQGLWEHGRVHGSGTAGLFQCATCSKTFASRQGYLIHNRTHTGERPYGCRFCMKAFRDGGTLRKHERIHTGERPHVCPICMHDFNQKVVLREHVRWVHVASKVENVEGFFECQICNLNIKDKEELCAHIVRHSDQLAAQAKGTTRTQKLGNKLVEKKITKKGVSKKIKEEIIADSEDSQTELDNNTERTDCESDVKQLTELLSEQNHFECDMCGGNFYTQKDLMTHVSIHI